MKHTKEEVSVLNELHYNKPRVRVCTIETTICTVDIQQNSQMINEPEKIHPPD